MSKFFVIAGCVFISLLFVFLTISYVPPFYTGLQKKTLPATPQTVFYFKPHTLYMSCDDSVATTTVYMNSYQNLVTEVQLELQYDPFIIHNLIIVPAEDNFFGTDYSVLLEEVREQYGRSTLAIEGNSKRPARSGNNAIATISFQAVSYTASQTASISFLNKSSVTNNSVEGSLLKNTQPLTIICTR